MAKQRKKKRGINPIRLLIVVAMEFLVILGLLIICVKVFPDNPILAPLFSKKAETPVVVLDAGHGGYDAGSTFEELYEKDVTLAFVKDIGARLEANGYPVLYTRKSDDVSWPANEVEDLSERVRISNESDARLFVSIHTNAAEVINGSYGYEIWGKMKEPRVEALSENILKELDSLGYSQNRGMKDQDLSPIQVLQNNKLPSILIEAGFLASENDRLYLIDDAKRKVFADKIADGIIKTLEDEKKSNSAVYMEFRHTIDRGGIEYEQRTVCGENHQTAQKERVYAGAACRAVECQQ